MFHILESISKMKILVEVPVVECLFDPIEEQQVFAVVFEVRVHAAIFEVENVLAHLVEEAIGGVLVRIACSDHRLAIFF